MPGVSLIAMAFLNFAAASAKRPASSAALPSSKRRRATLISDGVGSVAAKAADEQRVAVSARSRTERGLEPGTNMGRTVRIYTPSAGAESQLREIKRHFSDAKYYGRRAEPG